MAEKDYIRWIRNKAGHEKTIGVYTDLDITYPNGDRSQSIVIAYELQAISGELVCDQNETLELRYFSGEEKPPLFTGSHEALWNDIFVRQQLLIN